MTRRERVIRAIRHQQTDTVPYTLEFTDLEYAKVSAFLGDPDFIEHAGNHIDVLSFNGFRAEDPPGSGYYTDDFGIGWDYRDAANDIIDIIGSTIPQPDPALIKLPPVNKAAARQRLQDLTGNGRDTFKLMILSFSLFERAWLMRGMTNLLEDMLLEPVFADAMLDGLEEYNLELIGIALEYGVDGILFGDDWGQQKGMIMSPALWRRFIKPHVARLIERIHSGGASAMLHSCGDIGLILPDLIDIGLDVYQTFQPEIYDIARMKREYGKDIAFWGGISTQRLLPFAAPEEVYRVVRETLDIMRPGGGFIAGPTHTISHDAPAENIVSMINALKLG